MYQQGVNSFSITQSAAHWSRSEDKLFEEALVMFPEESPDRWQNIASKLPGKSSKDVMERYEALVHDLVEIDADRVELPNYADDSDWDSPSQISFSPKQKHGEPARKKGTPWTEEEHRLFLIGLSKFGKGDWRSISRNVVVTRTPTQVASHAQKYFIRHSNGRKRERKRSSIHDITTVDNNAVAMPVDQNWIPSPSVAGQQQPSALQQFPPQSEFPCQVGLLGYHNYGFPM